MVKVERRNGLLALPGTGVHGHSSTEAAKREIFLYDPALRHAAQPVRRAERVGHVSEKERTECSAT